MNIFRGKSACQVGVFRASINTPKECLPEDCICGDPDYFTVHDPFSILGLTPALDQIDMSTVADSILASKNQSENEQKIRAFRYLLNPENRARSILQQENDSVDNISPSQQTIEMLLNSNTTADEVLEQHIGQQQ
ncbi:hypothetical protein PCE1_002005 [Barthelona sp. PCE]